MSVSFEMARLMARSTLSLGMFSDLAVWISIRSRGLPAGSGPPALTAITISLPSRVKVLAILPQRLNLRALRNSKALPITLFGSVRFS